jgi:hypothetical protein
VTLVLYCTTKWVVSQIENLLIDMLGSTQTMSDGDTVTLPTPPITPPADKVDGTTAAYTVNGDGTAIITFTRVSGADAYSLGFEDE